MSGHSKWHQIKHKKAAVDAKRGQEFTRLAKQIQAAARTQGTDPAKNSLLREAIERARQANMPQANIDRLLSKASNNSLENITYEAFGPAGIALMIMASTENNNRTVAELRAILKEYGGTLGQPGSVKWKFKMSPDGGYQAQYPIETDLSAKEKIVALLDELQNHTDVERIFTDATLE